MNNGIESVDYLISNYQRTVDDLLWSDYTQDDYTKRAIYNLEREIDYLCGLRDTGVMYEPMF